MAFDSFDSPSRREFSSHCQRMLSLSEDYKEVGDSDCGASDSSYLNSHCYRSRRISASYASDSASVKLPDTSDASTPRSLSGSVYGRDAAKAFKTKSVRDLECEESLRRLHSLVAGDSVYFCRAVLGTSEDSDDSDIGEFVEGKVTCFSYDFMRRYVIVSLDGYGSLKFTYGDLHAMALDGNVHLQRLQQSVVLSKAQRQKRPRYFEDEYMTRRSFSNQNTADDSEDAAHDSAYGSSHHAYSESSAAGGADFYGIRTRPVPPGAESICRCRFVNKVDLVQKLRSAINKNKQEFYERTETMQELRLITTQNVRAYELEMVAYLLGEDPWAYAANHYDRPTDEQIKEIVEQYGAAARNAKYLAHFANWQKFQKQVKN
ncbi:hypothetical protein, conserved [Babesia bigemina]|uniref:Uncharacterized protein n=1 Tax=Babesia bigemina TaxID=5866 RepID=A0A061D8P5_BABBI|nr:hypothetical protein, conserved [Babesia bigemina]CDR94120.1 hypothetical protein, conserved [Babesia bigemina]|eukprot:XP_012766306.1 hypothetical protein, conserved [Babesia bigemina]